MAVVDGGSGILYKNFEAMHRTRWRDELKSEGIEIELKETINPSRGRESGKQEGIFSRRNILKGTEEKKSKKEEEKTISRNRKTQNRKREKIWETESLSRRDEQRSRSIGIELGKITTLPGRRELGKQEGIFSRRKIPKGKRAACLGRANVWEWDFGIETRIKMEACTKVGGKYRIVCEM
ncbi:hypothetical protein CEXT_619531 [Caerostris extrusa]|uniref:Uncharacterized protein n=1 Tax=Caerostris extrusa TaxID=172846 RepID=A0AAV4R527_CAEEX|nr:hypothetical protein CEXT_619531 [Caerostris extrusa]